MPIELLKAEIERLKAENEKLRESNRWLDAQVTTLREQRDRVLAKHPES